MKYHKINW